MQSKRSLFVAAFTAVFGFLAIAAPLFAASKEKVLHSFNGQDGNNPFAVSLIFDMSGNLYGTTAVGGRYEGGTVFQVAPGGSGKWAEKVLHNFHYFGGKGGAVLVAGVIFGSDGNLYGTASNNGAHGHGTVFQLTPAANGKWTENVLCDFRNSDDGNGPFADVTFDSAGHLYGTTIGGGPYGYGTVFQLTPAANGKWTEKVLHNFGKGNDGATPNSGLILDTAGNLYGTTSSGGANPGCPEFNESCGTVFQLTQGTNGEWTEKVLHNFGIGNDGATPDASLILDTAGNLYGTTYSGGKGTGTVFQLTPGANGKWIEKVLYSFCSVSGCTDGANPYSGLIFDASGSLYGATTVGGATGDGVVFKLTPAAHGKWTEKVLHTFGEGKDGAFPGGGLVFDEAGNLYGTTEAGGLTGNGTVFEIMP